MANASRVGDNTQCIELGLPIIRQVLKALATFLLKEAQRPIR